MLIDTHCHLTYPELAPQVDAVVARARDAGVTRMIHIATTPDDAVAAAALLRRFAELRLVVGVHPHEAGRVDAETLARLRRQVRGEDGFDDLRSRIVGVGETGLDFHYDFAPRDVQERVFRAQLEIAIEHDKPVVIHARESEARVCEVLAEHPTRAGRVVLHCFSGGPALAERALALGCMLSFTGVVTFKKSAEIQAAARAAPLDRIMVETDAPYLSPEPVRKVRPNEPAFVVHTARFLADIHGVPFEALAAQTTANAVRFFALGEG